MAEYNKTRYYWIKLTDRFLESDTVDFLMSQKDGANYVVLYQMLCLKTVNNNGVLARQIGEILVPYDIEKIVRDCKFFSIDTVRIALELYKRLGLVYEQEDGILRIADFDRLVGSQTYGAEKKQLQLQSRGGIEGGKDVEKIPPDIDIEKDTRYKRKDKEIDKDEYGYTCGIPKSKRFVKPTVEQIEEYCRERKNGIDAQYFYDYYEARGWLVGKTHMKDWKATVRTWERNGNSSSQQGKKQDKTHDFLQELFIEHGDTSDD